jgi:hypothetical protein
MRSLMQVIVAVLAMLCSRVAKADTITAHGGGRSIVECSSSGEAWDPSCDGFTMVSFSGPNEGVSGANGGFFIYNLDAAFGSVFISLPGHPISSETDMNGDVIYTFAAGTLGNNLDGAGCVGGSQPPGFACVPSLGGGGVVEPGVDPSFTGIILGGVTVEDESSLCVISCYAIKGLVEFTVDRSLVQYAGFGTDTFVGRFSVDPVDGYSLSATGVPEVSSVVLLGSGLFVIALFRRRARKPLLVV